MLSIKQQMIAKIESKLGDKKFIENKAEEKQQVIFKCVCCGQEHDFSNSIDYVGAVTQWQSFGNKCYACGRGFCGCETKNYRDNFSRKRR